MRGLPFGQNMTKHVRNILCVAVFYGMIQFAFGQASPHGTLSMQCTDCHTTENWSTLADPMKFNHANTSFALYGQHRNIACKQCHTDMKFAGTPRYCISCHAKDYDAALTIDHRTAGFSTDCTVCHAVDRLSWQASFDHNKTQFPIRGAHEAVACNTCHVNNRYRGIPVECVACHQSEFLATVNPNHQAAGFSTDCAVCHRALTWIPAAFYPHSFFPIKTGDTHHPGVWSSCVDCHPAQPTYSTFECINCHEHTRARTDPRHDEVPGYQYLSSSCYHCHPTGSRG